MEKIERPCTERVLVAPFHAVGPFAIGFRIARDHVVGRRPARPCAPVRDIGCAGPLHARPADADFPRLDELVLQGDRECLYLVLRNLHEDAVEHTPAGGEIVWRALACDAGLSVEDEGPGVAEEELSLVTQRFYRAKGTKPSGTGLGLTIASIAADRFGLHLTLSNRDNRTGLRCALWSRPI